MARTLSFKRALHKSARLCGLDPDRLEKKLAESFAEWIESRLNKLIKKFPWPELCPTEERPLRDAWSAGTSYTIGDQVAYQDPDTGDWTYWQADGFPGAGLVPGSDDAEGIWASSSDYPRLISYEQADAEKIYDVLGVWRENPETVTVPRPIDYELRELGILLPRNAPATVWVQWRRRGPKLTTVEYSASTTYTVDDVFYLPSDGHCYVPLETIVGTSPATVPELFVQQAIPERIVNASCRAVKADWLADDGQDDKSFAQERRGEDWAEDDMADLTVHQHQTGHYAVRS
ncbi:MAG TPA: hypothetical protein VGQ11_02715 [Candidatus Acidoferrales bacterium]|jgi:hypothetical protein|nr:hypothetical protein [Candidatus Acidoferrales bacterium]